MMKLIIPVILLGFSVPVFAQPFEAGTWDVRGGINLDLDKTINLGGDNQGTRAGGGVNLGIGYFITDNIALDVDNRLSVLFSPETRIERLSTTPGVRFHPTKEVFVRAGTPIAFAPEFGFGALAGLGYRQPIGEKAAFVFTVDYTYWLTEYYQNLAPNGQLEVSAGIQTSF